MRRLRTRESGQAAVESALTLPLTVFLILGTLQLFLMLQARIVAEYAAFRAVRAGSVHHGNCEAMTHSAILALMPSFHSFMGGPGGSPAQKLARAFAQRRDNRFVSRYDGGHTGSIVWIARELPLRSQVPDPEDPLFDQPDREPLRLEARLVFWFPLTIPFANWVISRILLARWGLRPYTGANPLLLTNRANWRREEAPSHLESFIQAEMLARISRRQYTLPLHATASLRMMTPARARYFRTQNCPPAPEAL